MFVVNTAWFCFEIISQSRFGLRDKTAGGHKWNGDMILGHTKLASVPKRYTLKPLFKPETCTSSPPNADMVSNSAPLNTFLLLQFTLSSVPV
jgi:hypothetical protein